MSALSLEARLDARIDKSAGPQACWPCSGKDRYGRIEIAGKNHRVHRLAWIAANGSIPAGMKVCHHCDNPRCANPAHLFLGTQLDNIHDMIAKGRGHWQRSHTVSDIELWQDANALDPHDLRL